MLRVISRILTTVALALAALASAPAASATTSTAGEYEAQIASLINSARASAGLPALTVSTSMSSVSRTWSQNMASTGVFAHNPDYSSQIPAGSTGSAENVAYGAVSSGQYSAISVHAALMASLGHRANILDPGTTHVGVGIAFVSRDGYNWVYLTENFATYPAGGTSTPDPIALDLPFDQIIPTRDMNGDGYGDTFGVDGSGRLALYAGSRTGALRLAKVYGTGWSDLVVHAPGDWNGDGYSDLVVVRDDGDLLLYTGGAGGGLRSAGQIGNGWTGYRVVPAGDVNGDRRADLLAIGENGDLWLYPGDGRGSFYARVKVGNGWNGFDLYSTGDMNRDGRIDILSIDSSGRLWFYAGRGGGYFLQRVKVGYGWDTYTLASGTDVNRDGYGDLLGRDSHGNLYFYAGRSGGSFAQKIKVGTGW